MRKYRCFSDDEKRFILNCLKEEWVRSERALKRHEIAEQIKKGVVTIGKSLLIFAALAGMVTIASTAPNILSAFGRMNGRVNRRFYNLNGSMSQLRYLKAKGFVQVKKNDDDYEVFLTKRGEQRVLNETLERLRIERAKQWDGTWWLVMFDVPRKKNHARNLLRKRLRLLGLEALQNSVFASRYACAEKVRLITRLIGVSKHVVIAHVDSLEGYGEKVKLI